MLSRTKTVRVRNRFSAGTDSGEPCAPSRSRDLYDGPHLFADVLTRLRYNLDGDGIDHG